MEDREGRKGVKGVEERRGRVEVKGEKREVQFKVEERDRRWWMG